MVYESDTGDRYVLRSAFVTEQGELDAENGTINVKFSAISCERI